MNTKWTAMVVCLVLMSVGVAGIAGITDPVDAVDGEVIEVSTGEELVKAMQNRFELTSYDGEVEGYDYEVTVAPVNISITKDIVLDDDSGLKYDSGLGGNIATDYFSGTIDGNGHTIRTSFSSGWNYLAESTAGQTTIKNLNIECAGGVFSLIMGAGVYTNVFYDGEIDITFENVTLKKYMEAGANDSAFAVHAYNCTINFIDCVNDADYNMGNYAGVFLGGMAVGDVTANFKGCINNGDITGNKTYLFIGNPSSNVSLTVFVDSECKNNGSLKGDQAALFADFGNNTNFETANKQYEDRTDLTSNISTTTGLGITASYEDETNKIVISGGDAGNTYLVSMLVYTTILGGGGTGNMTLTLPMTDAGVFAGWFLDKNTAQQKYGLNVDGPYSPIENTEYSYKTVTADDGQTIYIVDLGTSSNTMTMTSKPSVRITGYDSNGVRLGSYQMSGITTALPAGVVTHIMTFSPGMYSYDISSSGGNIVKDGESFEFIITPASGYKIIRVSYGSTDIVGTNGLYKIENVTADATITVETERVSYDVITNLEGATISNNTTSVAMGEGFEASVEAMDGYVIESVTVIMGGTEYPVSGNVISIPQVTGNIVITVKAVQTGIDDTPAGNPSDDDELPPFIPTQPAEDDDTVTIVACAAAAAVAAIMAVFLIIDRKG